jgi:molybdopterin molybdotransferase
MLTPSEALRTILAAIQPLPASAVNLDDALGRILAEDVISTEAIPPFINSAMDGYAVRGANIAAAPARLKVIGERAAGKVGSEQVETGTALRIMTGAPMPVGADTVVPVELTAKYGDEVEILKAVKLGMNIRQAGEDVRAGETVLTQGTLLRPSELGLLAALGRSKVRVVPAPIVAVITTGDELVDLAEPLGPGQIRDANLHSLCAQVRACGAIPLPVPRVKDVAATLETALRDALERADAVITNGGISMGEYDHIRPVMERLGIRQLFWQVAQKPGKPMAFSLAGDKPVFGVPGNPVSALICFEEYVRPALRKMMGQALLHRPEVTAHWAEPQRKSADDRRVHFHRVLLRSENGQLWATSTGPQGSGILTSMTRANALALLAAEAFDVKRGDPVRVHLMDLPEDH